MIDFHTHTLLSDGELLACELARRAEDRGYRVIGFTDHVDSSNIETVIPAVLKACKEINSNWKIKAIPGVEITHMPPTSIGKAVKFARSKGIRLVCVHGETPVECVLPGTNRAAILARPDILTHPGMVSIEDAKLAAQKKVYLEISARKGHSLTNGHVAKTARLTGADLVINTDSHGPRDLITKNFAEIILAGAGLDERETKKVFKNAEKLARELLDIRKLV